MIKRFQVGDNVIHHINLREHGEVLQQCQVLAVGRYGGPECDIEVTGNTANLGFSKGCIHYGVSAKNLTPNKTG